MKPKLIVCGAAGRMGKRIISLAIEANDFDVIAAIENKDHPDIGKDAGLVAGVNPLNVTLDSVYPAAADVVIDFSIVEVLSSSSLSNLLILRGMLEERGRSLVLCNVSVITKCIFRVAGLDEVFDFADDKPTAVAAVHATAG